jgi:hypothetical protein
MIIRGLRTFLCEPFLLISKLENQIKRKKWIISKIEAILQIMLKKMSIKKKKPCFLLVK